MKTRKTESAVLSKKAGVALFTVLTLLATLSLLASFSYMVMRTDMSISNNYVKATKAFYQTEAGIHYVRNQIEQLLKSGAPLTVGENAVNIEPPEGFTFDPVHSFTVLDSRMQSFLYSVTGHSGDSKTTIEVVVARRPLIMCGLLGENSLRVQPQFDILSFDSRLLAGLPAFGDSSGEASVGSNYDVTLQSHVVLDGNVLLGAAEDGTWAVFTGHGVGDWETVEFERFDPDPLGSIGGNLADQFTDVIANNDNASADPPIVGNTVNLGPGDTLTLTAGDYYLTSMDMGPKGDLIIDASAGPVNIYLDGEWYMGPNGTINNGGLPTDLSIFSRSDERIWIQPNSGFSGFIYAPFSTDVWMKPHGDAYGAVWAKDLRLFPQGYWFIDVALLDKFMSDELHFASWKEIRS
ncbi:MAG TPA: hypothetical protein PKM67_00805 [Kiritimatiellia bacterium]|nr:hypothetical protein [Kiritimatiellia bacterium]HNS79982.1 hypothetical protein [Kiritimatiellia bacterium]HPA77073.1 hypothetical protein [Kiritimatiellia bacterium]HQQ03370.1 hypothetical protein [Kiritimatiellia bacterium]